MNSPVAVRRFGSPALSVAEVVAAALGDRVPGAYRGVRDRCGAEAGLVGEGGPLEADDEGADQAAFEAQHQKVTLELLGDAVNQMDEEIVQNAAHAILHYSLRLL